MRHLLILLSLAACAPKEAEVITNTPASIAAATFADSLEIDIEQFDTNAAGLYWRDLTAGEGAVVQPGQVVTAHYDGRFPDGSQFETSYGRDPIRFPVGTGRVIPGWDQGIVGMRVGGKRQLIIPAALAYGPGGSPPVIPANATLVFTVEVVAAQ